MVDPYQDEDDETCIFGHPGCDIDIHLLHIKHADELLMLLDDLNSQQNRTTDNSTVTRNQILSQTCFILLISFDDHSFCASSFMQKHLLSSSRRAAPNINLIVL
jgi:hypothetical protein